VPADGCHAASQHSSSSSKSNRSPVRRAWLGCVPSQDQLPRAARLVTLSPHAGVRPRRGHAPAERPPAGLCCGAPGRRARLARRVGRPGPMRSQIVPDAIASPPAGLTRYCLTDSEDAPGGEEQPHDGYRTARPPATQPAKCCVELRMTRVIWIVKHLHRRPNFRGESKHSVDLNRIGWLRTVRKRTTGSSSPSWHAYYCCWT
jgi:hypothetical protein